MDRVVKFLSSPVVVRGSSSTTSLQRLEAVSIVILSRFSREEVWPVEEETKVSCGDAVVGRLGIKGDKRVVLPSGAVAIAVSFRGKRLRLWSASTRIGTI